MSDRTRAVDWTTEGIKARFPIKGREPIGSDTNLEPFTPKTAREHVEQSIALTVRAPNLWSAAFSVTWETRALLSAEGDYPLTNPEGDPESAAHIHNCRQSLVQLVELLHDADLIALTRLAIQMVAVPPDLGLFTTKHRPPRGRQRRWAVAEFNDRPNDLFNWDSATPLERGKAAHDELVASEVLRIEPMAPPQPAAPPQVTRISRGLALLPVLVLAVVLILLLASCKDDQPRTGTRTTQAQQSSITSTPVVPQNIDQATPAPVQAASASDATPCANGVVPPPTPVLIWCDGNSPDCLPTTDFRPAKYPCATNAEIDAWLQGDRP